MYEMLTFIVDLFTLVVILIISVILLRRIIKEKKETEAVNTIKILILGIFISLSWALFWEFLYDDTPFTIGLSYETVMATNTFSLYNMGAALMITFGLTLVCYYNQWKMLYIVPWVILIVLFLMFLTTGYGLALLFYIYSGGILVLSIMIYNSFKLRDNNLLGLCVFFILTFITNILEGTFFGS